MRAARRRVAVSVYPISRTGGVFGAEWVASRTRSCAGREGLLIQLRITRSSTVYRTIGYVILRQTDIRGHTRNEYRERSSHSTVECQCGSYAMRDTLAANVTIVGAITHEISHTRSHTQSPQARTHTRATRTTFRFRSRNRTE